MTVPTGAPVLVTGVAGFIGSNLADRLLAEGYRVVGVDDLSQGVREQVPAGVTFHRLDIRSPDVFPLFRDVFAVFHLAARNCIADCQLDPVGTASVNVTGTVNVFEAARRAGVGKVVYAESSALYEGVDEFPTPETHVAAESVYAVSKLAARAFARTYARYHGMRPTGLRYFCVYGPRQDYRRTIPPVMSAFAMKLLRGERPSIFGSGEKRRDFVHVDDVNDFHLLCLKDERTDGGCFNIGSGDDHSVIEIYEMIRDIVGSDLEPQRLADLPGEAWRTCADITAARSLGWEPRVGLAEGLRGLVAYIRAHVVDAEAAPAAAP
ncbi:MAG: NAD-dependent epimerase/dehydratase family protein [Longimicrobiales bacterium]